MQYVFTKKRKFLGWFAKELNDNELQKILITRRYIPAELDLRYMDHPYRYLNRFYMPLWISLPAKKK
jgi:hypothetical protein